MGETIAFVASRSGEPDGVSLRTIPPAVGVRGLTPPGSPDLGEVDYENSPF